MFSTASLYAGKPQAAQGVARVTASLYADPLWQHFTQGQGGGVCVTASLYADHTQTRGATRGGVRVTAVTLRGPIQGQGGGARALRQFLYAGPNQDRDGGA